MSTCSTCGNYYRNSYYNKTRYCDDCLDESLPEFDPDCALEAHILQNPTGKTPAVFYDDRDHDDSFGL